MQWWKLLWFLRAYKTLILRKFVGKIQKIDFQKNFKKNQKNRIFEGKRKIRILRKIKKIWIFSKYKLLNILWIPIKNRPKIMIFKFSNSSSAHNTLENCSISHFFIKMAIDLVLLHKIDPILSIINVKIEQTWTKIFHVRFWA